MNVRSTGRRAASFALGLAVVSMAGITPLFGQGEENPYASIVERNVFALKDPPPPPPPPDPEANTPPAPAATIRLTGITSIFSKPKALLEITEPTSGAKPQKLILNEGEREGEFRVVSIDFDKKEVMVETSKGMTNVTFAPLNAAKTPAPAAAPTRRPGRPTPRRPGTTSVRPTPPPTATSSGGPTIIGRGGSGTRGVTVLGADSSATPSAPANTTPTPAARRSGASYSASATAANRLRSIPRRTLRVGQDNTPNNNNNNNNASPQSAETSQPAFTKEQLRYWIEANRMVTPELPWPKVDGSPAPPSPGGSQ